MEQTKSVNENHIQFYARTIQNLLNENLNFALDEKIEKLSTLFKATSLPQTDIDKLLADIKTCCLDSYFNGASDKEMQIFSDMAGGKFFGDTAYEIIDSIIEYNKDNPEKIANMLDRYIADRNEFLDLAQQSIDKLIRMGLVQAKPLD